MTVKTPGVVAAMIAGAHSTTTPLLAFCDDDVELPADWLGRALMHLEDPRVGACSGRDVVDDGESGRTGVAGTASRWGRLTGEHHRVTGPARAVDVLKGANMLWRRAALELPVGLRGTGAEVHYEVAMCGRARRSGWRLILDPAIEVQHRAGVRFGEDLRGAPSRVAIGDAAWNLVVATAILQPGPAARTRRLLYGTLVGDRGTPGLVRAAAAWVRGEHDIARRLGPSLGGQLAAEAALLRGRPIHFERL